MQNLVKDDFSKLEAAVYEQAENIKDIPVEHTFIEGVYARHGKLEQGSLNIGHSHNFECINILAEGILLIKNSMEDEGKVIKGPCTFVTQPGNRKIVYAVTDAYMYNIFRTDETDVEVLEDTLVEKSEAYLKYKEDTCLEYQRQPQ